MGESQRSEQATTLQEKLSGYMGDIEGMDVSTENRFEGWSPEFNYQNMSKIIDQITQGQLGDVNRSADYQIGTGQSDLAERMASEGVSSSSIKDAGMNKISSGVNRNRANMMSQIFGNALGAKQGAMSEANKYDYMGTQGAQSADQFDIKALLRKYGVLGGFAGQAQSNLGNLDNTTWLDDMFAGLNTASGFVNPLSGLFKPGAKPAQGGGG